MVRGMLSIPSEVWGHGKRRHQTKQEGKTAEISLWKRAGRLTASKALEKSIVAGIV